MKKVKIGLLGLGTVGSGCVNIINRNGAEIARRLGKELEVIHASARDINKPRNCDLSGITLTTDPFEVVNNPEVDVVVELIGGYELAKDLVNQAIANGKHVVTANKALIAVHGNELFAKAAEQGVSLAYEAAVAGGIPIIKAIREGLAVNRIQWLAGIINGTGNFILTEMRDKGRDFTDVLKEAQQLGYAEADPTFDVEGIDAAHKLTILASIAFGIPLQFDKVYTQGISNLAQCDVEYAQEFGYRIKHLGIARKTAEGIELRVHPTLIPQKRLIANVDGVMNAVLVKSDAVGPTLYYGPGAGSEPTASAVVADVVDIARVINSQPDTHVPYLGFAQHSLSDDHILAIEHIHSAYYLRAEVEDHPGVLAKISQVLADRDISIEAIHQNEVEPGQNAQVVLITGEVVEQQILDAIKQIKALPSTQGEVMMMRVEHLG